jgi:hypothetical protein
LRKPIRSEFIAEKAKPTLLLISIFASDWLSKFFRRKFPRKLNETCNISNKNRE